MRAGDNLWVMSVNSINMYRKPREWEAGTIAGAGGSGNDTGLIIPRDLFENKALEHIMIEIDPDHPK
ncbi:hypothetical protein DBR06_SOUSAS5910032, partial [Sousa chinensis]